MSISLIFPLSTISIAFSHSPSSSTLPVMNVGVNCCSGVDDYSIKKRCIFLLIVTTLFVRAIAQGTSTFDPNSVDLTTKGTFSRFLAYKLRCLCSTNSRLKDQWCQAQTSNCPTLCGGQSQTKDNSCTGVSSQLAQRLQSCINRLIVTSHRLSIHASVPTVRALRT